MIRASRLTALHLLSVALYVGTFASIFHFFSQPGVMSGGLMVATWAITVATLCFTARAERLGA